MIEQRHIEASQALANHYQDLGRADAPLSEAYVEQVEGNGPHLAAAWALSQFFDPSTPLNTVVFKLHQLNAQAELEAQGV